MSGANQFLEEQAVAKVFNKELLSKESITEHMEKYKLSGNHQDIFLHLSVRKFTNEFDTITENFFGEWGLSGSRFVILSLLNESEQGLTPTEIVKKVGVTNATVSTVLAHLKSTGLVQALTNEQDNRSYKIQISAQGKVLVTDLQQLYHDNTTRYWSYFSSEEKEQLTQLLTRMGQLLSVFGNKKSY